MPYKKSINILVLTIVLLSAVACLAGLFAGGGEGATTFETIRGEVVDIYGEGLYRYDSVSVTAQGKASDLVTLILGIPLLLAALYLRNKGSFRGELLLTGALGFFLYTYMSYSFLWNYNPFFIVYVILMSCSLYAFILSLMSINLAVLPSRFGEKLPVKFLGGFQIFLGVGIGLMWLGKLAPTFTNDVAPAGLEHYTTLVIQGMDLGFVVPTAILSGVLLLQRKPFGYLLTSVIIIKGATMLTALSAMILNMMLKGVTMSPVETIVFPLFNLVTIGCLVLLLKNIVDIDAA